MSAKSDDVSKPFQKAYESVERLWIDTLQRAVRSRPLLGAGGKLTNLGLGAAALRRRMTERVAAFWGLPTADQQRRMLTVLERMEGRIADLEEQLAAAKEDRA